MPVPAERVGPRTTLVNMDANTSLSATGGVGLYARVSSQDQMADLERQTARLAEWAAKAGHQVVRAESEIASGMNGRELFEAALSATGRRLVVLDDGEVEDDLERDVVEVQTSFCARLYGQRSAKNRAHRALQAAAADD